MHQLESRLERGRGLHERRAWVDLLEEGRLALTRFRISGSVITFNPLSIASSTKKGCLSRGKLFGNSGSLGDSGEFGGVSCTLSSTIGYELS